MESRCALRAASVPTPIGFVLAFFEKVLVAIPVRKYKIALACELVWYLNSDFCTKFPAPISITRSRSPPPPASPGLTSISLSLSPPPTYVDRTFFVFFSSL